MILIEAAFSAPLAGVDRSRQTVHAIDMEHVISLWLAKRRTTTEAVCGIPFVRPVKIGEVAMLWPPAVRDLPYERCRDCFDQTGKKRPRCRIVRRAERDGGPQ